jgi:signal transduction histidine kinase
LENGHLEPDLEPVDLPAIVDTSLHQISPLLTLHQVKTKLVLPTNLPLVYADPYITQRVFENLLDNAIKFSPSRSTIIIRATANQEQVTVSIEDQGPGIAKDQQSEIFNQFSQIKNADKPSSRVGFGLGLTFCHLAVQAMNGSIWVESDGESGTDFLFTLPVYSDEE